MTTRYRLPAELGGGEYVGQMNSTGTVACLIVPGIGEVELPGDCLTEVKPPLPPEPPAGSVVLDKDGDVWQRDNETSEYGWAGAAVPNRVPWSRLYEQYGPLRRLVPDPADDAFELPWRGDGDTIEVSSNPPGDDTPIWVDIKPSWRTPVEARQKAALLLRAAREVEQP